MTSMTSLDTKLVTILETLSQSVKRLYETEKDALWVDYTTRLLTIPTHYNRTPKYQKCARYHMLDYERLLGKLEKNQELCLGYLDDFKKLKEKVIELLAVEAVQLLIPLKERQGAYSDKLFEYLDEFKSHLSPDIVDEVYRCYLSHFQQINGQIEDHTIGTMRELFYMINEIYGSFCVSFHHPSWDMPRRYQVASIIRWGE